MDGMCSSFLSLSLSLRLPFFFFCFVYTHHNPVAKYKHLLVANTNQITSLNVLLPSCWNVISWEPDGLAFWVGHLSVSFEILASGEHESSWPDWTNFLCVKTPPQLGMVSRSAFSPSVLDAHALPCSLFNLKKKTTHALEKKMASCVWGFTTQSRAGNDNNMTRWHRGGGDGR